MKKLILLVTLFWIPALANAQTNVPFDVSYYTDNMAKIEASYFYVKAGYHNINGMAGQPIGEPNSLKEPLVGKSGLGVDYGFSVGAGWRFPLKKFESFRDKLYPTLGLGIQYDSFQREEVFFKRPEAREGISAVGFDYGFGFLKISPGVALNLNERSVLELNLDFLIPLHNTGVIHGTEGINCSTSSWDGEESCSDDYTYTSADPSEFGLFSPMSNSIAVALRGNKLKLFTEIFTFKVKENVEKKFWEGGEYSGYGASDGGITVEEFLADFNIKALTMGISVIF